MNRTAHSVILERCVAAVFPTALVFSLFLLFAGHNAPGGGFVGGLVAGAALVLRYVDGGVPAVARVVPVTPQAVLGSGLTLAVLTAAAGWMGGGDVLESSKLTWHAPLLGSVKATTALPFDIGVYLVVVGLVLSLLRSLGGEEPE